MSFCVQYRAYVEWSLEYGTFAAPAHFRTFFTYDASRYHGGGSTLKLQDVVCSDSSQMRAWKEAKVQG